MIVRMSGAAALALTILVIANLFPASVQARGSLRPPPDLQQRVGFDQRLGAPVPRTAAFRDANGAVVRLGDIAHGRPLLLVPGYYGCANLCGVVRAGVANAIRRSGLAPGRQFEVALVSIDPHETAADARTAQRNDALAHPGAGVTRWHYLTGTQDEIASLMRAIGFRYFLDERDDQYAHAAGIVLLTPGGRVAQYLFGVRFAPETLRLALVGASHGGIGNIVDRLLLLCCDYDAGTGRYDVAVHRVMQALGIGSALALCGWIWILRRGESSRARTLRAGPPA